MNGVLNATAADFVQRGAPMNLAMVARDVGPEFVAGGTGNFPAAVGVAGVSTAVVVVATWVSCASTASCCSARRQIPSFVLDIASVGRYRSSAYVAWSVAGKGN